MGIIQKAEDESLLHLTRSGKKKKTKQWYDRAAKGETMRII